MLCLVHDPSSNQSIISPKNIHTKWSTWVIRIYVLINRIYKATKKNSTKLMIYLLRSTFNSLCGSAAASTGSSFSFSSWSDSSAPWESKVIVTSNGSVQNRVTVLVRFGGAGGQKMQMVKSISERKTYNWVRKNQLTNLCGTFEYTEYFLSPQTVPWKLVHPPSAFLNWVTQYW